MVLSEKVYVEQPKGFEDPKFPYHVYRLKKTLHKLKQSPKAWYERLTTYFLEKKFEIRGVDKTLFINKSKDELLVAQIYVDDIIFGTTSNDFALSFSNEMKIEFEMSTIGELTFFLGLQIRQLKDRIFLSQSKYARELVKKIGLESTKHSRIPMSTTTKLCNDESRKYVQLKLYRNMIGSLLYLTTSHPDISFSVEACVRYQSNPKESHLKTVKRIINGSLDYGLWNPYDSFFMIVRYSDANQVENVKDRKSTSGVFIIIINDCLVTQLSKKQNSISLSIVEVECIATRSCYAQLLWTKKMFKNYGIEQRIMNIHCENSNVINISKNLVFHSRDKHIEIRYHFIKDLVEEKFISLEFVSTEHQLVDIFTKPLDSLRFKYLRKSLGICLID